VKFHVNTVYVLNDWENTGTTKHDIGRSLYSIILFLKWIAHTGFFPGSKNAKE
jgi:hypothetical protein